MQEHHSLKEPVNFIYSIFYKKDLQPIFLNIYVLILFIYTIHIHHYLTLLYVSTLFTLIFYELILRHISGHKYN